MGSAKNVKQDIEKESLSCYRSFVALLSLIFEWSCCNYFDFSFSPLDSSGGYSYTSNAFIFSLRNKEGLAPFKSMVTRPSYAIFRNSGYGPTFGGGYDIRISDSANTNTNSYTDFGQNNYYSVPSGVQSKYTILAGTRNFTPDEVEVFYLGWVTIRSYPCQESTLLSIIIPLSISHQKPGILNTINYKLDLPSNNLLKK